MHPWPQIPTSTIFRSILHLRPVTYLNASQILHPRDAVTRLRWEKPKPLPIDWEVPTHGCELAIRGTGQEIGYLNINDARIRDFLQPAIFPEDIEIWPPGSRSEIAWLHFVRTKSLKIVSLHRSYFSGTSILQVVTWKTLSQLQLLSIFDKTDARHW